MEETYIGYFSIFLFFATTIYNKYIFFNKNINDSFASKHFDVMNVVIDFDYKWYNLCAFLMCCLFVEELIFIKLAMLFVLMCCDVYINQYKITHNFTFNIGKIIIEMFLYGFVSKYFIVSKIFLLFVLCNRTHRVISNNDINIDHIL